MNDREDVERNGVEVVEKPVEQSALDNKKKKKNKKKNGGGKNG